MNSCSRLYLLKLILCDIIIMFILFALHIGGDYMNRIKKLNKKQTAKNAYKLIAESKYSIEWVALSLDISNRVIYYWQEGKRYPSIEHVYGLSQLFGVSVESILA